MSTAAKASKTITTIAHHIGATSVLASIVYCSDRFEIKCFDPRSYTTWVAKLSVCHVGSMYQRHSFDTGIEFWGSLARSVSIGDDGAVVANSQHIVFFPQVVSSAGTECYLIYQAIKHTSTEETWEIDFLSEIDDPFLLEIIIKIKDQNNFKRYIQRVESKYLYELFSKHCFSSFENRNFDPEKPKASPVLDLLIDGMIFERENDLVLIKPLEMAKLSEFAQETISDQQLRAIRAAFVDVETERAYRATILDSISDSGEVQPIGSKDVHFIERRRRGRMDGNAALTLGKRAVLIGGGGSAAGGPAPSSKIDADVEEKDEEAKRVDPVEEMQDMVSESLLVRPDQRSRISRECIISFLMTYSKLGPCLRWSSDADLMRLAGTCFLCEPPAQGKEILAAQETPINTCYIIVRGTMPHFIAGGLNVTRRVGDIIGGSLLTGSTIWEEDIELRKGSSLTFCAIPATALLRLVGKAGPGAQSAEYARTFWQFSRLWSTMQADKLAAQHAEALTKDFKEMFALKSRGVAEAATSSPRGSAHAPLAAHAPSAAHTTSAPSTASSRSSAKASGVGPRSSLRTSGVASAGSNSKMDTCNGSDSHNLATLSDLSEDGKNPVVATIGQPTTQRRSQQPTVNSLSFQQNQHPQRPEIAEKLDSAEMDTSMSAANMNVCDSARIRIFQAGEEIFSAKDPRYFLYVVIQGECAVLRYVKLARTASTKAAEGRPASAPTSSTPLPSPPVGSPGSPGCPGPGVVSSSRGEGSRSRSPSLAQSRSPSPSSPHMRKRLSKVNDTTAVATVGAASSGIGSGTGSGSGSGTGTASAASAIHALSSGADSSTATAPAATAAITMATYSGRGRHQGHAGSNSDEEREVLEIDTGQRLMGGDFSFMDGETGVWLRQLEDIHADADESARADQHTTEDGEGDVSDGYNTATGISLPTSSMHYGQISGGSSRKGIPGTAASIAVQSATAKMRGKGLIAKKKAQFMFGSHKHTLLAVTRVEVCVIPLREIAKSKRAFGQLLGIVTKKYGCLAMSDSRLMQRYLEEKLWSEQRTFVLNEIFDKRPPSATQAAVQYSAKFREMQFLKAAARTVKKEKLREELAAVAAAVAAEAQAAAEAARRSSNDERSLLIFGAARSMSKSDTVDDDCSGYSQTLNSKSRGGEVGERAVDGRGGGGERGKHGDRARELAFRESPLTRGPETVSATSASAALRVERSQRIARPKSAIVKSGSIASAASGATTCVTVGAVSRRLFNASSSPHPHKASPITTTLLEQGPTSLHGSLSPRPVTAEPGRGRGARPVYSHRPHTSLDARQEITSDAVGDRSRRAERIGSPIARPLRVEQASAHFSPVNLGRPVSHRREVVPTPPAVSGAAVWQRPSSATAAGDACSEGKASRPLGKNRDPHHHLNPSRPNGSPRSASQGPTTSARQLSLH